MVAVARSQKVKVSKRIKMMNFVAKRTNIWFKFYWFIYTVLSVTCCKNFERQLLPFTAVALTGRGKQKCIISSITALCDFKVISYYSRERITEWVFIFVHSCRIPSGFRVIPPLPWNLHLVFSIRIENLAASMNPPQDMSQHTWKNIELGCPTQIRNTKLAKIIEKRRK